MMGAPFEEIPIKPFVSLPFRSYAASIPELLDAVDAGPALAESPVILVKPNLVNAKPFPVTSHPASCREVLAFVRRHAPAARLIVADGCGDPRATTMELFDSLGFSPVAKEFGAELMDLNEAPLTRLERPDMKFFRTIHLPTVALSSFVISLAALKAHSLAGYTGALKNMMGLLPPLHYAQRHGFWRKAALHADLQRAILELNLIAPPVLSILDASLGLAEHHLGGAACHPPAGMLAAGSDPWRVDRYGAGLLGLNWRTVGHLADGPGVQPLEGETHQGT